VRNSHITTPVWSRETGRRSFPHFRAACAPCHRCRQNFCIRDVKFSYVRLSRSQKCPRPRGRKAREERDWWYLLEGGAGNSGPSYALCGRPSSSEGLGCSNQGRGAGKNQPVALGDSRDNVPQVGTRDRFNLLIARKLAIDVELTLFYPRSAPSLMPASMCFVVIVHYHHQITIYP